MIIFYTNECFILLLNFLLPQSALINNINHDELDFIAMIHN